MDDGGFKGWGWLWTGGGALIWAIVIAAVGYLKQPLKDRIVELERRCERCEEEKDKLAARVVLLESQASIYISREAFWQEEYRKLREAHP